MRGTAAPCQVANPRGGDGEQDRKDTAGQREQEPRCEREQPVVGPEQRAPERLGAELAEVKPIRGSS